MNIDELSTIIRNATTTESPTVCINSQLCKPGDIFVAINGTKVDGYDFIDKAIENGAKFIVTEKAFNSAKAQVVIVNDTKVAAAILAQISFDNPSDKLTNLAVTGTNGKTTVTFMVKSVIISAQKKCGLVGTIINETGNQTSVESNMTTPDAIAIAKLTAEMVKASAEYMVIEASSHAIDQRRLAGIKFKAAAFTNLTGDHLDYHKTMENYLNAKAKLFTELGQESFAILNAEDLASKKIAAKTTAKKLFYGIDTDTEISAAIESMDINGTVFTINYNGQSCKVTSDLLGRHNISNHLAAAGLCIGAGFSLETIAAGLSKLKRVPGRLEAVNHNGNFAVLIDYAHTDDALKNVLKTLKPLCKNKLCVVFGCGGDRDKTKRPRMAAIADQFADKVIVTSDNPRTEDAEGIITDIMKGFSSDAMEKTIVQADRKKAIAATIKNADDGDIILLAGKGHENYQIIGTEKIHFSDAETAREFLL